MGAYFRAVLTQEQAISGWGVSSIVFVPKVASGGRIGAPATCVGSNILAKINTTSETRISLYLNDNFVSVRKILIALTKAIPAV